MSEHGPQLHLLDRLHQAGVGAVGPLLAAVVVLLFTGTAVAAGGPQPERSRVVAATAVVAAPAMSESAPEPIPEPTPELTAAPGPEPVDSPAATPALEPVPLPIPPPADEPVLEGVELAPAEPRLAAFAGLSTWIDVYDEAWTPEQQAEVAWLGGAEAIFVQSARHVSPGDIHDPDRLGRLIEAAHDRGLKVMVWYIPDFLDPERDLRRSVAAIEFTTPRGDRPDAFGLDIELEELSDVSLRNQRLLQLSAALREHVGPDYPLAAIVLPPLQLDLRPAWWPAFPWAELRTYYDVWVPMSYSSFRGTSAEVTYTWNLNNVLEMRRRTGDPDLRVHLAGGIADDLPHVDAFVAAASDGSVLGAGLYDLDTTRSDAWPQLRRLRTRP